MKKNIFGLGIAGLILSATSFGVPSAFAASTATQTLSMVIASTSNISTSGNPGALSVTLNAAGTGTATDNSTSYTVVSNTGTNGTLKITGAITTGGNMPTNTSLTANLTSNSGTSQGAQTLSSTPVDLVLKLPTLVSDTGAISYAFNVTNGWSVAAQSISRTITLTLTSGS